MNETLEYFYKYNRIFSTIITTWPYQDRAFITIKRVMIVIMVSIVAYTQAAALIVSGYELSVVNEMGPIHLTTVAIAYILVYIYVNDENMKLMWDEIYLDWEEVRDDYELEIKMLYASIGRKITVFIFCLYGFCLIIFIFVSTFFSDILDIVIPLNESRPRQLPFKIDYIFISSEGHYLFYLITMQLAVIYVTFISITVVVTMWTQFIHVFGLQKLTGLGLQRDFLNASNNNLQKSNDIYHSSIIICIKRHQRFIKMRALLDNCYIVPTDVILSCLIFILTVSMVQFSKLGLVDSKPVFQLFVTFALSFLHSLFCQVLTNNAEEMANNIYCSEWYRASPKSRKLLAYVLYQAHQPFVIKALKIFALSFVNFREVLRLCMSYFTVMSNVQ